MAVQLNQRERIILVLAFITVVVYLGYSFYFIPMEERHIRLQSTIAAQERELQRNMETLHQGTNLEQQVDSPLLKVFEQNGSDEEVMAAILNQIEKAAGRFNFEISQLKPNRVRRVDFYNHFSVNLTIEAELKEILNFVHILQNEPFYFSVDGAVFDKRLPNSPILRTQLTLSRSLIP